MLKIIFYILVVSQIAKADFLVNLDSFYFSDTNKTATTLTDTRTYVDFGLGIPVGKRKDLFILWNITSVASTAKGGTAHTFSSLDMGPKLTWLGKNGGTVSLSYNLSAIGTYKDTQTAKWTGTSILADVGFVPQISDSLYLGLKLNYYSNSVAQSVVGSTTYKKVAYARTWIFPSIALTWHD